MKDETVSTRTMIIFHIQALVSERLQELRSNFSVAENRERPAIICKGNADEQLRIITGLVDSLYLAIAEGNETTDNLMSTINHLNDLLKIRNDEISKLRGI